ncbi:sarcosine oxidase subunit gamma [Pseudokineococcus sp. 1T1Z-3]|uniref:sarcosine oxidase subunit gamma n=1 Tax=Pseudokineococcus sp. 1T1Z-3 TaxID=3132745 RepID=UPI003096485D
MAETLTRSHPLATREDLTALTGGAVQVQPYLAMVLVQASGPAADVVGSELGVELPGRMGTWTGFTGADGVSGRVLRLAPDELLVVNDDERPWELEARLRAAAAPLDGSAVDVSAQRVTLRLHGPHAREVLAAGCSLDTHPSRFGAGACAQVPVGETGVVLVSLSDDGDDYLLLVRSSFARYLADWLVDVFVEHVSTP